MAQSARDAALLIIDVQNDFCPGGSLAVENGNEVIPVINRIAPAFPLVVATKDWHPDGHISFASSHAGKQPQDTVRVNGIDQILWPKHCVKGSVGAQFHPDLDQRPINLVLHKGVKLELDSYSAFFENDKKTETGLQHYLRGLGFTRVFIAGLAEDVCVFFSAMDARSLGLETFVVKDATRGVDLPAGRTRETEQQMEEAGVTFVASEEIS